MVSGNNFVKNNLILSVVLLPILFMYATPIPGLSIGDVVLIFSWVIFILANFKKKLQKSLIAITAYVVFTTLCFEMEGRLGRVTTSLRYVVYLMIMITFPTLRANLGTISKTITWVGIFAMGLLFIQYIFYVYFHTIIPGVLTFMPLMDSSLNDYSEGFKIAGRCMSVFAEPSHYAIFMVLFLVAILFRSRGYKMKQMVLAVLASISIVLCSSFTGIIMMMAVWGIKIVSEARFRAKDIVIIICFLAAMSAGYYVFADTVAGKYLFDEDMYQAHASGRFDGFDYIISQKNRDVLSLLLGFGMNDIGEHAYLPGWPRLFYYYGIIGSILYIISFIKCTKIGTLSFIILIVITGLMVGTEMNFSPFILPYMLLLICTTHGKYIDSQYTATA